MPETTQSENTMQASLSTLVMSVASSAVMSLGLAPNPQTGKTEKNKDIARFNIDLLVMLKAKTNGNLEEDEKKFLDSVIADLQVRFVQTK